jgi:hypothetical protein
MPCQEIGIPAYREDDKRAALAVWKNHGLGRKTWVLQLLGPRITKKLKGPLLSSSVGRSLFKAMLCQEIGIPAYREDDKRVALAVWLNYGLGRKTWVLQVLDSVHDKKVKSAPFVILMHMRILYHQDSSLRWNDTKGGALCRCFGPDELPQIHALNGVPPMGDGFD